MRKMTHITEINGLYKNLIFLKSTNGRVHIVSYRYLLLLNLLYKATLWINKKYGKYYKIKCEIINYYVVTLCNDKFYVMCSLSDFFSIV